MTPRINWLASYPKSGNTWVRAFLSALQHCEDVPVDVNSLSSHATSFQRRGFDEMLGFDTGNLSAAHCARLRPVVYRWMNAHLDMPVYCKTHDACTQVDTGEWLMAPEASDKALYIIRNPLDVTVSFAHFAGNTFDEIIRKLGDSEARLARQKPTRQISQVEQLIGSWSFHVKSWTENTHFTTQVVRYEDMINDPQRSFTQICSFLGISFSAADIDKAISKTSFKVLQSQEKASGFRENPQTSERFFRSGKIGEWQEVLTQPQVNRVLEDHLRVMQKFGYADEFGAPRLC